MRERGVSHVLQIKRADPLPPAMAFTDATVAQVDEALLPFSFLRVGS